MNAILKSEAKGGLAWKCHHQQEESNIVGPGSFSILICRGNKINVSTQLFHHIAATGVTSVMMALQYSHVETLRMGDPDGHGIFERVNERLTKKHFVSSHQVSSTHTVPAI